MQLDRLAGELGDSLELVAGDPYPRCLLKPREPTRDLLLPERLIETSERDPGLQLRIERQQVPAQPLLKPGALRD